MGGGAWADAALAFHQVCGGWAGGRGLSGFRQREGKQFITASLRVPEMLHLLLGPPQGSYSPHSAQLSRGNIGGKGKGSGSIPGFTKDSTRDRSGSDFYLTVHPIAPS